MSQLAFIRFDPDRAPEQEEFLRSRVTLLRESGGQYWVRLEDPQVATLAAQGMEVTTYPDAGLVALGPLLWRPAEETAQPPAALTAALPTGDEAANWLVLFVAPPDKSWLQELMLAGAEPQQQVGSTASVYRMTAAEAAAVRALPQIASVGLFHPAYVPALDLCGLEAPLSAAGLAGLQLQIPPGTPEEGNLEVRVFEALDPAPLRAALEAAGATVVTPIDQGFVLHLANAGAAPALLAVPGLLSAASPGVAGPDTPNAGVILGANQVRDLGTVNFLVNLDGSGEIGAVVDTGFDVGALAGGTPPPTLVFTPFHPDLAANIRLLANSDAPLAGGAVPDPSPHGTHVAGTIAGDGSGSGNLTRGIAPRAALIGLGPIPAGPISVPFSFAADRGAHVINNSWGINTAAGLNNRYGGHATAADRWCHDNPDVLIVFTAGNLEADTFGGPDGALDARTLRLHSIAKNVLCIGATENLRNDGGWRDNYRSVFPTRYPHAAFNVTAGGPAGGFQFSDNSSQVALFSNRGLVRNTANVSTGRIKPDVVAPGTNILSCRSQWVAVPPALPGAPPIADPFYSNNADSMLPPALGAFRNLYQLLSGTSMAAPVVTGAALLVRQYYRSRHAQLRRPLLLQGVPMPAAAPQPGFASRPAIAAHPDGLVCAWITPALAADPKRIVAMRIARHHAGPVDAAPVPLQANVGEHAALRLLTLADRTYLLHRHGDGKMRLSGFDRALAPLAGFGTAGVLTLAPDARPDDAAPPGLLALGADQLACVWPPSAGSGGFFQRIRAADGTAVDNAPIKLLNHASTGGQQALAFDGSRLSFCGVAHGASFQLQLRQIDLTPLLHPAAPVTALDQAAEIREPCLLWDPRSSRYLLAWCDARNGPGGEIWLMTLDAQLSTVGVPRPVVSVIAPGRVRRPQLAPHPREGFLLAWEDDTQNARFDLYATLLDGSGAVDGRIAHDASAGGRRSVRLTDTPGDADGYSLSADAAGYVFIYQNPDEVNADRIGVYTQNLSPELAFEAQADTATPFLRNGRYEVLTLLDHASTVLSPISAVWTGGSWDLLRQAPGVGVNDQQQWLRLTADGLPDARHGVNGLREQVYNTLVFGVELLWTGNNRRVSAINDLVTGIRIHLDDVDGAPIPAFGAGGSVTLADAAMPPHDRTTPQLGFFTVPAFTVIAAYGSLQGAVLHLRQQRLRLNGSVAGAPAELASCDGVAAHGWYIFVNGIEACGVAIYHRTTGADTQVLLRRYSPLGAPLAAERLLSTPGEARNGYVARRPLAINSPRREYGAVWQYRSNAASRWEIRFSRVDRQGVPMANPPVAGVVQPVSDLAVINAVTPDWDPARDAVEPQLVSTYLHEAWTNPPPPAITAPGWSPSWGLAWIGVDPPGGVRRLYFTMLDENGRRLAVQPPPPPAGALAAPAPAPLLVFGSPTGRVQDFRLAWNGRIFMLSWTEEEAGRLKSCCTLVNRHASQDAYALPSAALLRATLVNGASNLTPAALPDRAAGYGWGLVNLRQSLAPALPVTLQVRDDCALGPGRAVRYVFTLPVGTALLRVTLNWTDPPGANLLRQLHLTVRAPAPAGPGARVQYFGNLWDTAAGRTHLSRGVAIPPAAGDVHEDIHPYKHVVVPNPPPGDYEVEVSVGGFGTDLFNQQNLQSFALVFAGTGPEVVFNQPVAAVAGTGIY